MEKLLFEALKASLNEAIEHAEGKRDVQMREVTIKPVSAFTEQDVKEVREK